MLSRPPQSIDDALVWMRDHVDPGAAGDLRVVYQLELTGPAGGELVLRVADGAVQVERGRDAAPQVRLRLAACDWCGILSGRENADLLYMAGRMEIAGDLRLASKLRRLFRPA